jgi:hypothetical protein
LADKLVSYSIYSESAGVAEDATAILIVADDAPLFTTLIVTTENVLAGTVYRVVLVAAERSATPSLPVAIIYSPCIYLV